MDYLGLFCLGAFVGALVTYGLQFAQALGSWQQLLATVIAAVFTGAVVAFLGEFKDASAIGAYPVGLLVALMWAYARKGVENINSTSSGLKILGWSHIAGATVISIVAAALVLPPAFHEAWGKVLAARGLASSSTKAP